MLPEINAVNQLDNEIPSYTYRLDIQNNCIQGYVDDVEAITQAVYLILQTERYESLIYNFYYGVEFDSLIGQNRDYVNSEIKRRITEALTEDDRINDITNFKISFNDDYANVSFTVQSSVGNINIEWEVSL